ncbi:uncharacterized protein LOC131929702 [Physella acuta]|uniref:uncharacterized protein LOC131929702 n=1 Tax=Physella acuta TaxID=109671 RepID=UPI0027DD5E10|nr:uncharacterized protein LOC131929702 [Physella acuta]XP_059142144.1 uncharacterized protein LOC131929702 [Physella acuta]
MYYLAAIFLMSCLALGSAQDKKFKPTAFCAPNAEQADPTSKCYCKPGFKGDGDLCCGPKDEGVCILRYDPILRPVDGKKTWVHYPCTHSVATVTKTVNNLACEIKVYTAVNYTNFGTQYDDRLSVSIQIGKETYYFQISNGIVTDLPNHARLALSRAGDLSTYVKKSSEGVEEFGLLYNTVQKRWRITACGGEVVFREPFNDGVLVQEKSPGICVIAPPEDIVGSVDSGNICNLNGKYLVAPYTSTTSKLLADIVLGYKNIPAVVNLDPLPIRQTCTDLAAVFQACSEDKRVEALDKCSALISSHRERKCFYDNHGADITKGFKDCVSVVCNKDQDACSRLESSPAVKNCLNNLSACRQWL